MRYVAIMRILASNLTGKGGKF